MGGVRPLCVRFCLRKGFYCSQGGCHLNLGNWTAPGSPGPPDFQAVLGYPEDRAQRLCPAFPVLQRRYTILFSPLPPRHRVLLTREGLSHGSLLLLPAPPPRALWAVASASAKAVLTPLPEAKRELQGPCAPQTTTVIFNLSKLSCTDSSFPLEYSFSRDHYGSLPPSSRPLTKWCLPLRPSRPPSPIILTLLGRASFRLSPPGVLREYLYCLSPPQSVSSRACFVHWTPSSWSTAWHPA